MQGIFITSIKTLFLLPWKLHIPNASSASCQPSRPRRASSHLREARHHRGTAAGGELALFPAWPRGHGPTLEEHFRSSDAALGLGLTAPVPPRATFCLPCAADSSFIRTFTNQVSWYQLAIANQLTPAQCAWDCTECELSLCHLCHFPSSLPFCTDSLF